MTLNFRLIGSDVCINLIKFSHYSVEVIRWPKGRASKGFPDRLEILANNCEASLGRLPSGQLQEFKKTEQTVTQKNEGNYLSLLQESIDEYR